MGKNVTYKIIQVPMDAGLLERVDAAAGRVAESRAAYIRAACERRIKRELADELDRRYREGYRRRPEKATMARAGAKLLARSLREDSW